MALHLVGETIDKTRSHYRAETGKLIQLMRGIYVDADDDIEATVLRHAVRIAKYLYPKAYLSAASAVLLGPTPDGRLFLSARRKQRTRISALEIIQNEAPAHPSVGEGVIDDGMGEFRIAVSSIRQRLVSGDSRYSPKSGMGTYPIASYKRMADARPVPVSSTILAAPNLTFALGVNFPAGRGRIRNAVNAGS